MIGFSLISVSDDEITRLIVAGKARMRLFVSGSSLQSTVGAAVMYD